VADVIETIRQNDRSVERIDRARMAVAERADLVALGSTALESVVDNCYR
jgi:hypothetical protein